MKKYIEPDWPAPSNIRAYTTTRNDGFSKKPYASFNLADHVGDDDRSIQANRDQLKRDLNLPSEPVWLRQTHSTKVISLDEIKDESHYPEADASYTTKTDMICAVLTADCLPILLATKDGDYIAVIHAGWQGLACGIIESTLDILPVNLKKLLVWFGPAIGPKAFLVKNDIRKKFIDEDPKATLAFEPQGKDVWSVNIYLLAQQKFASYGVTNFYGGNFCTFCDEKNFFSYRRDHGITGRMASLIFKND